MANHGKYYIAVRLLLLKQYLEANNGRTRIIRAAHPRFVDKTPLKTQKGSTSQLFWGVGCASMFYFSEKWGLNFFSSKVAGFPDYFRDSSTATATLTVIPTMGLLPVASFFLIEPIAFHFVGLSCRNRVF